VYVRKKGSFGFVWMSFILCKKKQGEQRASINTLCKQ
jgi:hypothetical protein